MGEGRILANDLRVWGGGFVVVVIVVVVLVVVLVLVVSMAAASLSLLRPANHLSRPLLSP